VTMPDITNAMLGRAVFDGRGERLGNLAALYADTDTDAIAFASVAMLRRGRRRLVFVPLVGARIEPDSITLRCGKQLVCSAPSTQAGHPLPADAEPTLFAHYDLPYTPATSAARRLAPAE